MCTLVGLSADHQPTHRLTHRPTGGQRSTDLRPTFDRRSTDVRPTFDRRLVDRPAKVHMISQSCLSIGDTLAVVQRSHCRPADKAKVIIIIIIIIIIILFLTACILPQYQRGWRPRDDQWVFGILSTESSPCRGYFEVVPRRDRATLAPILQRVLLPGSELHLDDWPGYRNIVAHVPNLSLHQVVVHRENFVDPVRGIHTQEAEAAWSRLRYYIKREKGIRGCDLQAFLNEQIWRDWRGLGNDFENMIRLLPNYYPLL